MSEMQPANVSACSVFRMCPTLNPAAHSLRFTQALHAGLLTHHHRAHGCYAGAAKEPLRTTLIGKSTPHGLVHTQVGQGISALVARVPRMALDPAPLDTVAAGAHQCIKAFPQLYVFHGLI